MRKATSYAEAPNLSRSLVKAKRPSRRIDPIANHAGRLQFRHVNKMTGSIHRNRPRPFSSTLHRKRRTAHGREPATRRINQICGNIARLQIGCIKKSPGRIHCEPQRSARWRTRKSAHALFLARIQHAKHRNRVIQRVAGKNVGAVRAGIIDCQDAKAPANRHVALRRRGHSQHRRAADRFNLRSDRRRTGRESRRHSGIINRSDGSVRRRPGRAAFGLCRRRAIAERRIGDESLHGADSDRRIGRSWAYSFDSYAAAATIEKIQRIAEAAGQPNRGKQRNSKKKRESAFRQKHTRKSCRYRATTHREQPVVF